MLGPVTNVHHPALFKMAIADVKVSMVAIDADTASPEFTAVEREVVVVELQEGDAASAVFEQAVFERGFCQRLAFVRMGFEDGGIGEAPKCQMPMRDLGLKSLRRLIVKSNAGFAATVHFKTDKSRISHPVQEQHRPAGSTIPNQLRVATVSNN